MKYNVIYDFCKVRNNGTALKNGTSTYPPRVIFLLNLLDSMNIEYEVDTFLYKKNNLHNIYLKGTSDKWVMAHHDVCNHKVDNANDNSASVINAIALKELRPDINIALVDGEEPPCMGAGSTHFANRFKDGEIVAKWVLNLELTGSGGTNFFIGNHDTELTKSIESKFGCAVYNEPFNDAYRLIEGGLNAALINPCPLKTEEYVVTELGNFKEYMVDDRFDHIEIGSKISERSYDNLTYVLKYDTRYSNEEIKFSVEKKPLILSSGEMPTVDQMDLSILMRCHSSEDSVKYLVIDDMKEFVEEVLVVIFDLC